MAGTPARLTPVRARAAAALVRAGEVTLPRLPRALLAPLCEVIGTLAYLAAPRARAAVRANHLVVAPGRRPRVRATFVNQVRSYVETFRMFGMDKKAIGRHIGAEGWEHAVAAIAAGKGAIMASAHLGAVSVCGQLFLARGYPVTLPVEPSGDALSRAVNRARARFGLQLVETDSPIGIHRVLRRGGTLGLIVDRAVTGVGERVLFFGHPALLPSAHVALALRSGAALVPAFAHRRAGRLVAEFEAPLVLARTGDHDEDVRAGVRQFARVMERHIAREPEQWAVFERIWS